MPTASEQSMEGQHASEEYYGHVSWFLARAVSAGLDPNDELHTIGGGVTHLVMRMRGTVWAGKG